MTIKPVVLRSAAERDVDDAISFYLREGGSSVALAFINALEVAHKLIAENPAGGSPRFAHELDLPGLRTWPLRKFPYRIFYVERADQIDIWRVLDGRRDIPAWLSGAEE